MGNVHMEARQVNYRGGEKPMSVEEAIKEAGSSYVLPVADPETLGGIKQGDGLYIDGEGVADVYLKTNGGLMFDESGAIYAQVQHNDNYNINTGNQIRIGSFISGQDDYNLYRSCIDCGAGPNNTTKKVTFELSANGMDRHIIDIRGIAIGANSSYKEILPVPYTALNTADQLQLYHDGVDSICLRASGNFTGYNVMVYVLYYETETPTPPEP